MCISKNWFYTTGCWNGVSGVADGLGFHAIKQEQIYHADLCNLYCIRTLYKCTFDATNQLATSIGL